ncbi:acyl-protein synthetase [Clostridium tyrobutyricum]|uniref:LuxE/PaaK family acyltransferase n=1 Tax=Clostridium tyrobutyricum TaxID=1519 RepID=UPI000AB05CC7|nr:acyl-protein synthetase [Clostridium tyrobutyricum]
MKMEALIENILLKNQFQMSYEEKKKILLPIIKNQLNCNKINANIKCMYNKLNIDISKIQGLQEVPFIPVNMFKKFDLLTCNNDDIVRILNSSSTTTGIPSKIYLDRITAMHQSQALVTTLKSFLGGNRRPLLVLDTETVNKNGNTLSARGAAIRGISNFASSITYVMDGENENLKINFDRLKEFEHKNMNKEILVYGFTYIIWSKFVRILESKNIKLSLSNMKLLHSGGWKKLVSERVGKNNFNRRTAEVFGTNKANIMDFYGMAEQLGVVFVDCEYGYKHVPDFADVIIRDFNSLEEVEFGQQGIIEVMSILGSSYPSQAILTEDVGELVGIDTCKCGRKGKYFKFRSRMEKSETRGCGDTFAERENTR